MHFDFTDPRITLHGLPWFDPAAPDLFRFSRDVLETVPDRVAAQARFPAGARVRFMCESTDLAIGLRGRSDRTNHGTDVYVDGSYFRTLEAEPSGDSTQVLFEALERRERLIEMYLPYRQEVAFDGIEIDDGASIAVAPAYRGKAPVVYYGSSVAQGVGAGRSSMSYEAIVSRMLDLDFVNLGFGGAGKAEPDVVELVTGLDACCFVFDLGKSYGTQPSGPYRTMLETVRERHPEVPFVCITPIFSTREVYRSDYAALSRHTRDVVTEAADTVSGVTVLDGLHLLGRGDADGLSKDGVHPSELGFARIAEGLAPVIHGLVDR